jgi:hypothetical protein
MDADALVNRWALHVVRERIRIGSTATWPPTKHLLDCSEATASLSWYPGTPECDEDSTGDWAAVQIDLRCPHQKRYTYDIAGDDPAELIYRAVAWCVANGET